jgi:hypothetical protein
MNTRDNNDKIIRKLILQKGPEKAPDRFTENIMAKIQAAPAIDDTPLLSKGTWIAIIAGLAAMIVVIFTVDIPFFDNVFSSEGIQKVSMNLFSDGFVDTMSSFFKGLNFSSITWMILAAALGLVLLDRLLRKRFMHAGLIVL